MTLTSGPVTVGKMARFGLILTVLIIGINSVNGRPQSDDWHTKSRNSNNPFDDPFFKKANEENKKFFENSKINFDSDFEETRSQNMKIFWIIAGVMFGIFILIVCCGLLCFFVPACFLAKAFANRRARRYQQPAVHSVPGGQTYPTQAGVGAYPSQPTNPVGLGYPYSTQQQQPLVPGQQPIPMNNPYPSTAQPMGMGQPSTGEKFGFNPNQAPYNPNPYQSGPGGEFQHQQSSYPTTNPPPYPN